MHLKKPKIFSKFPEISFGLSTKFSTNFTDRFHFNMSKSIGDIEELVLSNRAQLFNKLRLSLDSVIVQKQTHSDIVNVVDKFDEDLEGDALITKSKNLGLAISTADCTNIYLYDSENKVIAAVHSGWMGTEKRILVKTLKILENKFNSNPNDIYAYFGPSICQKNYEVGEEFKQKFDSKYMLRNNKKLLLDLKTANKDMLLSFGITEEHIEVNDNCSFDNENLHSYRRDKENSGRALGVIAIMEKL